MARFALPSVIFSGDGLFAISAPPATAEYRAAVLTFAHTVQQGLEHDLRVTWPRPDHPIVIALGIATNDTRILAARLADSDGGGREQIEIPDPEHGDLDLLRACVTRALLRQWLRAAAANGASSGPVLPPDWLILGISRHLGGQHRLDDADAVYAQWSRGRLPTARELLTAEPCAAMRDPAMQAVVAAWLLGQPNAVGGQILRRLSKGTPWTPALVATLVCGAVGDSLALDEAWDAWQLSSVRDVRQPGTTSAAVAQAFQSQLLLYPADYGIVTADGWRGRTFSECLDLPRTDALRDAVLAKARQLRLFATGRDTTLQHVAEAYAQVLDALASGAPTAVLKPRLAAADDACRQMMARIGQGGALRDPPPAVVPSVRERKRR